MFGITPVAVLGAILNIINLIVLRMHKTSLTSVFLLRILAGCDLFFLVTSLVFFTLRHAVVYITNRKVIFGRRDTFIGVEIFYATIPIYFCSLQARNWLVVLLTVERFLNIVFPLWAKTTCSIRNFTKIIMFVFVSSLACHLPRFWSQYLIKEINPCTGLTEFSIKARQWETTYDQYVYIIALVLVPLFLIYILNTFLIIALRRAMVRRSKMAADGQQKDQGQNQATMTVVSVVILFTICETPASMDRLAGLAGFSQSFAPDGLFRNYMRKVGLLLIVFDSSVNFVAYCASNRTFRRNLVTLFSAKHKQPNI
jgi:hypothetical protein